MKPEDIIQDITEEAENTERTKIVVRLRRSFWHDNNGAYQKTEIKYLKKQTKGFNVFDDDCAMVGADQVIGKILDLEKCEDGLYQLVTCNEHRDWETGHVEDWDYRLIPLKS